MTDETAGADFVLETRGAQHRLEAHVVAASVEAAGQTAAFALGDGTVALISLADPARLAARPAVHDGTALALAADCGPGAFLVGGDDGRFARLDAAGEATTIAAWPGRWVEHVMAFPGKGAWRAAACGKGVHLFAGTGEAAALKSLTHPSTVTGIATDGQGKRIAASHYNGVSLWFVGATEDRPRALTWKGSHIGVTMSPDGRYLVTSMQENALHGWRLEDGADMRMSGYPAKTKSLCFTARTRWLATSGAEAIVCWPFSGDGPMGRAPRELAGGDGILVSQVACHPQHEVVAAGFADGLVVLVEIESGRVLPVAEPGRGAVTALAWSPDGRWLAFGTETGFAAVVDFSSEAGR